MVYNIDLKNVVILNSATMMRHELQMLPVEHRAKLYMKLDETQNIHYILQSTGDNEMDGPDALMSQTRTKTIGGADKTTKRRHRPMGTTTIRM